MDGVHLPKAPGGTGSTRRRWPCFDSPSQNSSFISVARRRTNGIDCHCGIATRERLCVPLVIDRVACNPHAVQSIVI